MNYFTTEFVVWAVVLGALSAVSLPLGSIVGLRVKMRPVFLSALGAFGAGALIAALSVELVAPTLFALEDVGEAHSGDPQTNFFALVIGAVFGGILFFMLDQVVNAHGGFLRKTATSIAYFKRAKRAGEKELVERLARFPLLQTMSSEHINALMSVVDPVTYNDGETIVRSGEGFDQVLFILKGTVHATSERGQSYDMEAGNVAGLLTVVMGAPSPGDVVAKGDVAALALTKSNFDRLRSISSGFDEACRELSESRLEMLAREYESHHQQTIKWVNKATHALRTGTDIPNALDLRRAKEEYEGAPLAIWLGMVIDGIPESFVIGAGVLVTLRALGGPPDAITFGQIIPYTLIAGLFLSNFPEALASSANMRLQGFGARRILLLWVSLMLITAAGAGVGFVLSDSLNHTWLIFAEGLAAGAMLTMIAAAMIPEAVHTGNANAVGLSTLAGFLAACSFKLLE